MTPSALATSLAIAVSLAVGQATARGAEAPLRIAVTFPAERSAQAVDHALEQYRLDLARGRVQEFVGEVERAADELSLQRRQVLLDRLHDPRPLDLDRDRAAGISRHTTQRIPAIHEGNAVSSGI